jgi:calcium-activated chloride channel regulator 4
MRSHSDFANGANPPVDVGSTVPNFRFIRPRSASAVLVLDISGSMNAGSKLKKLVQVSEE